MHQGGRSDSEELQEMKGNLSLNNLVDWQIRLRRDCRINQFGFSHLFVVSYLCASPQISNMSQFTEPCHNCESPARLICSECLDAAYCDESCQSAHFDRHEMECIGKRATRGKRAAKRAKVMREFQKGKLHSGSKTGPIVTNPKQAVAIAYSEAKRNKK